MRTLFRLLACLLLAGLALQLFFVLRIAAMAVVDPQSTAFQRSEAWQIAVHGRANGKKEWAQRWVPYAQISDNLKRAVIASEDGEFVLPHHRQRRARRDADPHGLVAPAVCRAVH